MFAASSIVNETLGFDSEPKLHIVGKPLDVISAPTIVEKAEVNAL